MKRLLLAFITLAAATALTAPAFAGFKDAKKQGRVREGGRRLGRQQMRNRGYYALNPKAEGDGSLA